MGVILVAGATGGVGKRVVKQLRERGYKVRCLVRDIDKAKSILGSDTDLVVADITKPETLNFLVLILQRGENACKLKYKNRCYIMDRNSQHDTEENQ